MNQFAKRIKKAQTSNKFARWSSTSDQTLSSSSSSRWNKLRRRSADNSNLKWQQSKVTINRSSFHWSSREANFQKKTSRANKTLPSWTRKSLLSSTILIGQIERQFFAFFFQKWTLETRRVAGVMLSPSAVLKRHAANSRDRPRVVYTKTLMSLVIKNKTLKLALTSNRMMTERARWTWMI